jgi:hypothetical protein
LRHELTVPGEARVILAAGAGDAEQRTQGSDNDQHSAAGVR